MSAPWLLALFAVLAAFPVGALLWSARSVHGVRPPLSPGRHFLFYAAVYSALVLLARAIGVEASLFAYGLTLGFLAGARGARLAHVWLYGSGWLESHPEAPLRDAARWHLPFMIGAVLSFAAAVASTL